MSLEAAGRGGGRNSLDDQRKPFSMNDQKQPISSKLVCASSKYSSSRFYNFWIFPTSSSPKLVFIVQKLFLKYSFT